MAEFEKISKDIYRLKIPFEKIYTSVFAFVSGDKTMLADTGGTPFDVNNYIIPALVALGRTPEVLLLSHMHSDHAGGIYDLAKEYPGAEIALVDKNAKFENKVLYLVGGEVFFENFEIIGLEGHTCDSIGVFNRETRTLVSFDSIQQLGVDIYRDNIADKNKYLQTIEKVRKLSPDTIIFSHEYDPYGAVVSGKDEIDACLRLCCDSIK